MFVPYRVAVREHLKAGNNELFLTFQSAFLKVFYFFYYLTLILMNLPGKGSREATWQVWALERRL